jgi:hypothetical protein
MKIRPESIKLIDEIKKTIASYESRGLFSIDSYLAARNITPAGDAIPASSV